MTSRRPLIVTVVCITGFIGAAATIPLALSDMASQIGSWYPPWLAMSAVVALVCIVGLWMMKRWSVIAYTTFFGVNQVALLSLGLWSGISVILPGAVIAIALSQYQSMD